MTIWSWDLPQTTHKLLGNNISWGKIIQPMMIWSWDLPKTMHELLRNNISLG
jgi:hypothetical protein